MAFSFTLRIDDEKHSLTKENGISIGSVGEILTALSSAIGMEDTNVVLKEIRGNCYALEFFTEDERPASNFQIVHNNLASRGAIEWSPSEREYAKVMRRIMRKQRVYFEALDGENRRMSIIREFPKEKFPTHYHERITIYGRIIQIGSRNRDNPYKAVVQDYDGENYALRLTKEQDRILTAQLSEIYRERYIRFEVVARYSLLDDSSEYTVESLEIPLPRTLLETINDISSGISEGIEIDRDALDKLRENG